MRLTLLKQHICRNYVTFSSFENFGQPNVLANYAQTRQKVIKLLANWCLPGTCLLISKLTLHYPKLSEHVNKIHGW